MLQLNLLQEKGKIYIIKFIKFLQKNFLIRGHVNYNAIPGVVYTYPEIASCGKTEEELK